MPLYVVLAAMAVMVSVPLLVFSLVGDRISGGRVNRNLREGLEAPPDLRSGP